MRGGAYRKLVVWQRAIDLVVETYALTRAFPSDELFGLRAQMRRAAVSVPSNIAEGSARSNREFCRFLRVALGSLAELDTQVTIARRLDLVRGDESMTMTIDELRSSTCRLLAALSRPRFATSSKS